MPCDTDTIDDGAFQRPIPVGAAAHRASGTFTGQDTISGWARLVATGFAGADALSGADGNDTREAGAGADSLTGGDGADHVRRRAAADGAGGQRLVQVFVDGDAAVDIAVQLAAVVPPVLNAADFVL